MGKIKNLSLRKTIVLYMIISLIISFYLSALIMRIASTVQNNIWWNYVDQEEYFEMAEGDGRRYLPDVPRPHSYEMKEFDYHVSEICDFLQTFTVLIVSVAGSIIAVFLFYKHKLKCPIEELELASRQVGRNNLDFHITYENEDEMGGLCKEFERMRGQLAENNQQLWKMLEEEKLPWIMLWDKEGFTSGNEPNMIQKAYGFYTIPFIVLIDKEGRIVDRDLRGEKVREAIERARGN